MATSGYSPIGLSPRASCRVPICWPLAMGASSGCWLTTVAFSLSASPLGTDSTKSFRKPALTVFSLPFQTRNSLTAWLAPYTFTVS